MTAAGSSPDDSPRRSPPADSTSWMYGIRLSLATSRARISLRMLTAVIAPPRSVGSLPTITHSVPSITPIPSTMPPPTA